MNGVLNLVLLQELGVRRHDLREHGRRGEQAGTNLASVTAANASVRTADGGNADDAAASGFISVFKRSHSCAALTPSTVRHERFKTSTNWSLPTSVKKLPSGRWHIHVL
jgi:hypothetical protein